MGWVLKKRVWFWGEKREKKYKTETFAKNYQNVLGKTNEKSHCTTTRNQINLCDTNKMAINADKTKCMLLTITQRFNRLNVKELNITIGNKKLDQVTTENLLGIKIDQFLSWKGQINKVHSRVSRLLGRFRQIKPFLPIYARIKYCYAFILPNLEYCCTVWGSAQTSKLLVLQKRAIRRIFDLPARETTEPYWHKLKWMKIDDRIQYKKAQVIYKALNGLAPQYLRDMYTLTSDVQLRPSRHTDNSTLYLPTGRNLQIF